MAGALGDLNIRFSADTVKLMSDMGRAAHIVESSIGKMQSAFGAVTRAAGALGVALGAGAFVAGIKNVINHADELGKLSQKVGITVENLSALKYAAELSDVSMEGLTTGLKKLATNMLEASSGGKEALALFQGLNVEFQSAPGNLLPTDAVLLKIADRFQKMEDGAAKSALAVKIFGREGLSLIPFLNQGAAGIENLKEELRRLGGVMTGEMAKKAEQFNDNMKSLAVAADRFKIETATNMVGALASITEAMKKGVEESGLLLGAWNALKEARRQAQLPSMRDLRGVQSEIGQLDVMLGQPNLLPSQRAALNRQRDALIRQEAEVARYLSQTGAFDPPRPNIPRVTPDASAFNPGGSVKADPFQQQMERMRLELNKTEFGESEFIRVKTLLQEDEALRKLQDAQKQRLLDMAAEIDVARSLRREEKEREEGLAALHEELQKQRLADAESMAQLKKQVIDMIDPIQKYRDLLIKVRELGLTPEQLAAVEFELQNKIEDLNNPIKKVTKSAFDFGFTFNSALEDAILNGKKLSDVVKSLAQDIARMVIRQAVTKPLADAIGGAIGKGIGAIFGGGAPTGKASGGPVMGGTPYVVGEQGPELFVPGTSGTIVPNGAMGGGVVTVNLTVNALDPRGATQAILANVPVIAAALNKSANARGRTTGF